MKLTANVIFTVLLLSTTILAGCNRGEKSPENDSNAENSGIQVLETEIERQDDEKRTKNQFNVRLLLPVDKNDFLRIDKEKTEFFKAVDDNGFDLLEAHKEEKKKTEGKWWHEPSAITGYGEHPFEQGVWADITLQAAPSERADNVSLSGRIALEFDTGQTRTDTLRDLPLKMDIEKDGVDTIIGKFKIYGTGAVVTGDTRYWSYSTEGDADILEVELLDNDDTKKMQESMDGRGVTSKGFALHESRDLEKVTLRVTTRIKRSEEIPVDMTIDIGE